MALVAVNSFSPGTAALTNADGDFASRASARQCVSGGYASRGGIARVGGGGRRIGAVRRKAGSSSFLGDLTNFKLGEDRNDDFADELRSIGAGCSGGLRGRRGPARAGGVFFIPMGPGAGRAGDAGTFARREWEKRQRAQQARLREMIEREIKARSGAGRERKRSDTDGNYEYSLLRELEKRLRAEEQFTRGEQAQDAPPSAAANVGGDKEQDDGKRVDTGASTYELMKELEKRLRAEKPSQNEPPKNQRENSREGRDGRQRDRFATGNFSPLYEQMREWERERNEQRAKLESLWNSRLGDFLSGQGKEAEGERERRFTDRRKRHETSSREEVDRKLENDTSSDLSDKTVDASTDGGAAAAGLKYPQSNGTVVFLKNEANGAEIYLVGTSHVSKKSTEEVKDVIERVKPDLVMVELCRKRYERMADKVGRERRGGPMAFMEQMVRMLTNGNVGGFGRLIGAGLASFYELLSYRGLHPGKEFQVAIEEGKKAGAKIVLGDQDIELTLKRLWEFDLKMSMQDVFKMFGQRVPDDIADLMDRKSGSDSDDDMLERMRNRKVVRRFNEEMEKAAPSIYKVLMKDRNEVMVKALRNLKGKVVAVVGLAHMDGMEQLWNEANEKFLQGQSSEPQAQN